MADSDSEGLLVVDDGNAVDDSICPICKGTTYIGETISCEKCEYWFHFECVGVTHEDEWVKNEDVPYFCANCGGPNRVKKPKKNAKTKKAKTPSISKPTKAMVTSSTPPVQSPPIKLKISLGKKKSAARAIELSPPRQIPNKRKVSSDSVSLVTLSPASSSDKESKRRKRLKSEDEEEKWLDAVESGNLQAVDAELKSIRDPKLMTARQRAMVDRKNNDDFNDEDSGHMSLSYTSTKRPKSSQYVDEEENQKIKAMKIAKRKELEQEKREQDRLKTIERLLNKQETTTMKTGLRHTLPSTNPMLDSSTPKIVYIQNLQGSTLTFPSSMKMPIKTLAPLKPPRAVKCAVKNCLNTKKYNCSKTGRPLCSLQCYKKNLLIAI